MILTQPTTQINSKKLDPDNGVILAFLSRSYHESVKNKNAYIFTQYGDLEKIDLDKQYLFYSRPKGIIQVRTQKNYYWTFI